MLLATPPATLDSPGHLAIRWESSAVVATAELPVDHQPLALQGMAEIEVDEVIPGLWIGNAAAAEGALDFRYTHVLNMAGNLQPAVSDPADRRYLHIKLQDLDNISPFLDQIYQFISDALAGGGQVLVHCQVGANRSAAACLAFLAKHQRKPVAEALAQLKAAHRKSFPGPWFQEQIRFWLGDIEPSNRQDGLLAAVKRRLALRREGQL